jgi:serine/threonine protein kinase
MEEFKILENYILNRKVKSNSSHEVWVGRDRKTNEKVRVYVFKKPLTKEKLTAIKRWISVSAYEGATNKILKYYRLFFFPEPTLIIANPKYQTLRDVLGKKLTIYEKISYIHQLIHIFLFLHGLSFCHGDISLDSILLESDTNKLILFKEPLSEFVTEIGTEELRKCGLIIKELASSCGPIYSEYIQKIISYYEAPSKEYPKDVYTILTDALNRIKMRYLESNVTSISLSHLHTAMKMLNLTINPTSYSENIKHFKDIFWQLSGDVFMAQNQLFLKVASHIEGLPLNFLASDFSKKVIENHAILKDIFIRENTDKFLKCMKENSNKLKEILQTVKSIYPGTTDPLIDSKLFEKYNTQQPLHGKTE